MSEPNLIASRDRVLAVWCAGYLRVEDVVQWAERALLAIADAAAIPTWLLELVEHGPAVCIDRAGFSVPPLDYRSQFALRAVSLDLSSDVDVQRFVEWAYRACMAENLEFPEVELGYLLDHLFDDRDRLDLALAKVREDLPLLLPACRVRAAELRDLST